MNLVSVVGARPQFVKAAAIARAIRQASSSIGHRIIHTGQHYDTSMSQVFFEDLSIPNADANLGVGSGLHGAQTGRMLELVEKTLLQWEIDWVLVYGDTNSTLAGALAATKLHLNLAHVEAGLRSYDRRMPEEVNRVISDAVSDVLFCPTVVAVRNLEREGFRNVVAGGKLLQPQCGLVGRDLLKGGPVVVNVGDVMFDALQMFARRAPESEPLLKRCGVGGDGYILVTIHRAENTDDSERVRKVAIAIGQLSAKWPILFPIHPRTRVAFERNGVLGELERAEVTLVDPLPYLDMMTAIRGARVVITDSGGVQKEAYCLSVPCVTLRSTTEWIETLEYGWNRLVEPDPLALSVAVDAAQATRDSATLPGVYGDGRAAEAVVEILATLQR